MASVKYALPAFLKGRCSELEYLHWLTAKARAHVRRDKKRGSEGSKVEQYKIAIHRAVVDSGGNDAYTGMPLRWDLISKYDNDMAKEGGRTYKKSLGDLPTVDHINDARGKPEFKICSWRVNDAKNDLTLEEFIALCKLIVAHNADASILAGRSARNLQLG